MRAERHLSVPFLRIRDHDVGESVCRATVDLPDGRDARGAARHNIIVLLHE